MQNVRLAQIAPTLGKVDDNLALRDERIELVYRELRRIRASRFGLDDEPVDGSETPREEVGS
jgi:hypothetical protein